MAGYEPRKGKSAARKLPILYPRKRDTSKQKVPINSVADPDPYLVVGSGSVSLLIDLDPRMVPVLNILFS